MVGGLHRDAKCSVDRRVGDSQPGGLRTGVLGTLLPYVLLLGMLIAASNFASTPPAQAMVHFVEPVVTRVASSSTTVLAIDPSDAVVRSGDIVSVTVWVQTDGPVDGAAAYIDFSSTRLRLKALAGGTALPDTIQGGYDNTAGTIDYAAGKLEGELPSSAFVLVTLTFEARSEGVSVLNLVTTSDGQGTCRWSDVTYAGSSLSPVLQGAVVTIFAETGGTPDPHTPTATVLATATPVLPTVTVATTATPTPPVPTTTHTATANPVTPAATPTASSVQPTETPMPGVIEGFVFEDHNGNGVLDSSEAGVAGVTVHCGNGSGGQTDILGGYRCTSLAPGSYTLAVDVPNGYAAAGPTIRTIHVGSGGLARAGFALLTEGTIQGVVYEDLNGNGIQDGGEPGVQGVIVSRGGSTVTTVDNGGYRFEGVAPGSHVVQITVPAGDFWTGATERMVHVGSGGAAQANFRLQAVGVVLGVVFEDRNGNGVQDMGEAGVGGVVVRLSSGVSTTTDVVGRYRFGNVLPGSYKIDITVPDRHVAGGPTERTISVGPAGSPLASFVLHPLGAVLGVVYEDLDGNGVQDAGEAGIGGVPVTLSGFGTTVTTSDGAYVFLGVRPGAYTIQITLPPAFAAATLPTLPIGVGANGSSIANFGLQVQSVVQGLVFDDANGNRKLDAGESGIGGVVVTLSKSDGGAQIGVTTDARGGFYIGGVQDADYRVRIAVPPRYASLDSTDVPVSVTGSGHEVPTFPLHATSSVFGAVFEDLNNNGVRDVGEQGVSGVTMRLVGKDTMVDQLTGTSGEFSFGDLSNGIYTVTAGLLADQGYDMTGEQIQVVVLPNGVSGASATALFAVVPSSRIAGTASPGSELELAVAGAAVAAASGISTRATSLGFFQFGRVEPGNYRINVTPPPGFTAVEPSIAVTFTGVGMVVNVETVPNGAIQGTAFEDLDGNGVMTPGESGIAGAGIRLLDGDHTIMQTVTTSNGQFRFGDLRGGRYFLVVESKLFLQHTPVEVTLTVQRPGANVQFAMARRHAISGKVVQRKPDGTENATELGFANILVTLRQRPDGPVWRSAHSNVRGFYRIDGLAAGTYVIELVGPDGFSLRGDALRTVELTAQSPGNGQNYVFRRDAESAAGGRLYLPMVGR
jgi:hypothetical protein